MKCLKLVVSTGWANGDHVDYQELPDDWDEMSAEEQRNFIDDCARDYLFECCESYGEIVDEED